LDFYHDLGKIVKHRSMVVLRAQWLTDVLRQLITIPHFNDMVRKLKCKHYSESFRFEPFWSEVYQSDLNQFYSQRYDSYWSD